MALPFIGETRRAEVVESVASAGDSHRFRREIVMSYASLFRLPTFMSMRGVLFAPSP